MKISTEKLVETVIVGMSFLVSLAATRKVFNIGKEHYMQRRDNIDDVCEVIIEEAE